VARWAWLADDGGELPFDALALERYLRGDLPVPIADAVELATEAFAAAARRRPLYLWLDDLGWSRDGAVDVVLRLLERGAAVLVVGTLRSGTLEHPAVAARLATLRGNGATAVRELRGFGGADRRALLEAIAPLARGTAETIAWSVAGTPLLLVHLVRAWMDEGVLVPGPDGWTPGPGVDLADLAARAAVTTALSTRIDIFLRGFGEQSSDAESVLIRMAVLGGKVRESLARAAVPDPFLAALVDEVLDRGLLDGLFRVADGAYELDHGLLREGLIERLPVRPDRNRILRDAGTALQLSGDHHQGIRASRVATLLRDAGDHVRALRILRRATNYSASIGDFDTAESLLSVAGQFAAEAPGPSRRTCRVDHLYAHVNLLYQRCDYAAALERLDELFALADPVEDGWIVTRARLTRASIFRYTNRFHECAELLERTAATEAAGMQEDDLGHAGFVLQLRAALALLRDDYAGAARLLEDHLERGLDAESIRHELTHRLNLSTTLIAAGELDRARRYLALAHDRVRASADQALLQEIGNVELWADIAAGDHGRARARLDAPRPRFTSLDPWRETERRLQEALIITERTPDAAAAAASTAAFLSAFERMEHDEVLTIWGMRRLRDRLVIAGLAEPAARIDALLEARRRRIEAGFRPPSP
jgi:hypothetical protein